MDLLESEVPRPRQARYQAALRPDKKCTTHSKVLPDFLPAPIHRFGPRPCIYRAFIPAKSVIAGEPPRSTARFVGVSANGSAVHCVRYDTLYRRSLPSSCGDGRPRIALG